VEIALLSGLARTLQLQHPSSQRQIVAGAAFDLTLSATDSTGNLTDSCASGHNVVYRLQLSASSSDKHRHTSLEVVNNNGRNKTDRPILEAYVGSSLGQFVVSDIATADGDTIKQITRIILTRAAVHYLQLHCACRT